MTPAMWRGLGRDRRALPGDVRVVVVRGAGPVLLRRHRPAHVQRRRRARRGPPPSPAEPGFEELDRRLPGGYIWLRDPAIVSIAAVQGHAIGAGFQLALACDLRVLADDARLCMKEPALGLVPDLTGTKPLVDIVGLPRAIELCLTGRTVGAREAAELRLAELVVPGGRAGRRGGRPGRGAAGHRRRPRPGRPRRCCSRRPGNTLEQQAAAERAAQARLLQAGGPSSTGSR